MDAFVCTKLTDNYQNSLNYIIPKKLKIPDPTSNEILVQIKTAGLNFFDALILESKYQHRSTPPFIPLSEFSGIVVKIGDKTKSKSKSNSKSQYKAGDRVCGFVDRTKGRGSLSQYSICNPASIWKMPDNMSFEDGASFVSNFGTSYMSLIKRGNLNSKQSILITAASGGMGTACAQIAKAIGCKNIIGCVGAEYKKKIAIQNGCTFVINYNKYKDWNKIIKAKYGGIDVFIDIVGGDAFNQGLKCMNMLGKVLIIGFTSGIIPKIKINRILLKNIDVIGVRLGGTAIKDYGLYRDAVSEALEMYGDNHLKPMIGKVYDFNIDDIKNAYKDLMCRRSVGKLLISIPKIVSKL